MILGKLKKCVCNHKGASLLVALAMLYLLVTIGTSVLLAASNTAGALGAELDNQQQRRYAWAVAGALTDTITADATWQNDILQEIYEAYNVDEATRPTPGTILKDSTVTVSGIGANEAGGWIGQAGATKIALCITDISLRERLAFTPEVKIDLDGDATTPEEIVVEKLDGETDMRVAMTATITITHKNKPYTLQAKYRADCTAKIESETDKGTIGTFATGDDPRWTLIGYSQ